MQKYILVIRNLGIGELTDAIIKYSETFICMIYNAHRADSVDAARRILFCTTGKPETLPPTSDVLRFHLMRVHHQIMMWRNAPCATPDLPSPVQMGWSKNDDAGLQPILMS